MYLSSSLSFINSDIANKIDRTIGAYRVSRLGINGTTRSTNRSVLNSVFIMILMGSVLTV